jgi:urate oxidase
MRPKPYRRVRFYPSVLKAFEGVSDVTEDRAPHVEHVGKRCCLYDSFYSSYTGKDVSFFTPPLRVYTWPADR